MSLLPIPAHEVSLDLHLLFAVCISALVVFLVVRFILMLLGR